MRRRRGSAAAKLMFQNMTRQPPSDSPSRGRRRACCNPCFSSIGRSFVISRTMRAARSDARGMDAERTVELTFNMTTATAATNARTSRTPTAIHKDEKALTTTRNFNTPSCTSRTVYRTNQNCHPPAPPRPRKSPRRRECHRRMLRLRRSPHRPSHPVRQQMSSLRPSLRTWRVPGRVRGASGTP